MCGIFGVWNWKGAKGKHLLKASELLRHRGPDDEGFLGWSGDQTEPLSGNDSQTFTDSPLEPERHSPSMLLHRRLSIQDLSPSGHQPMRHRDRNIHIVFNGEIYNFKSLIEEHGLEVQTGTDTEVLLLMYEKFGVSMFHQLRGMWALCILDLEHQKMVLSRDRFGIKPLYLAESDDGLAFSSEVKPLLQLPGMRAEADKKMLISFVAFGASADPFETFFKGISALKPGSVEVIDLNAGSRSSTTYYDLRSAIEQADSDESFDEVFRSAMKEHLIADVEVGSCLSGGLDSSSIVCEAADQTSGLFKTFTCTFPGEEIDEGDYARRLNSAVGNLDQHFTTPTAQRFLNEWDTLILNQERPFGSASIYAQYAVMNLAADQGVKVLLDGQGADEMLGGYYPFAGAYLLELLRKGKLGKFRKAFKDLKQNFNPNMTTAMLRSAYYAMPDFVQRWGRQKQRLGIDLLSESSRQELKSLKSPDRGHWSFKELGIRSVGFGLYELLHYEDRNSMAFSIESRVPFLDHRLVEWALSSPTHRKLVNGWTKFPIRQYLDSRGFPTLAWRVDKLGFVAPQDRWKKELGTALTQSVANAEIPSFLNREAVQNLMTKSLDSNAHQSEFWRIFALLRWIKLFDVKVV